jgi:flagellar motor switch protein FliG
MLWIYLTLLPNLLLANLDVESSLKQQLGRFCQQSCDLLKIDISRQDVYNDDAELGFEALRPGVERKESKITRVDAKIQIDEKVSRANREQIDQILRNHLAAFAPQSSIEWSVVRYPSLDQQQEDDVGPLIERAKKQIHDGIRPILQKYCPDQCLLSFVDVSGRSINADQAAERAANEVYAHAGKYMHIRDVHVEITMDERLESKEAILNMIRSKLKFMTPVHLDVVSTSFPAEPASKDDPYGLEKLRQMLIMFRDLASTKEIITSSNSSVENSSRESIDATKEQIHNLESKERIDSSLESESNNRSSSNNQSNSDSFWGEDIYLWISIGLAGLLLLFLLLRFYKGNQDAQSLIQGAPSFAQPMGFNPAQQGNHAEGDPQAKGGSTSIVNTATLGLGFKAKALKQELSDKMIREPFVAREAFTRMLKEDGPEEVAKYLQIFGSLVTKELVGSQALAAELNTLSDFFRQSSFNFTEQEELDLLYALRTKLTAAEILVMGSHYSNHFEFLSTLEISQIHRLIQNEKMSLQAVVLTQVDKKTRLGLFDLYQGENRVKLMNELVRADMVPRELLENIAKALRIKVEKNPEYNSQAIPSYQIIFDLLEKSELNEQRQIVNNLRTTNPEVARNILSKLITVEIVPYLRDGHLLEIVLGIEHADILAFLAGIPEHIRKYMLQKAPYELAEAWMEELSSFYSIDPKAYKIAEIKVFQRIRNLSQSGMINIFNINELIFDAGYLKRPDEMEFDQQRIAA